MSSMDPAGTEADAVAAEQAGREKRVLHLLREIQIALGKITRKLDLAARCRLFDQLLLVNRAMCEA